MSAGPAEITGLTQSIAYAEHLAEQAGRHSPDGNEDYLTRLAAARVTGAGLATGRTMQDAFAAAAAAANAHAAALGKQLAVQEAYDQAPDAGDKTYLTSNAGDARDVTSSPGPTQAKESPVDEDDDGPIDRLTGLRPKALAAYRDYNKTTLPFLDRHTEQRRIEAEHDARPELVDQGRRTAAWYRAAGAALRARTEQIDGMVAGLRPGDRVRKTDDPDGVVWTVRETRDGNDGWVWLGLLRTREDSVEVGTGCRARGVDLVAAATDDEHAAVVKAELLIDLKNKWITPDEYDAALRRLEKTETHR